MTLNSVTIQNGLDPEAEGAGIYNLGTLTINDGTITNNKNSGFRSGGGAIFNKGTALIANTTISSNTSGNGSGGIRCYDGSLTITDSIISANTAGLCGGGILTNSQFSISASTFSGNTAGGGGGAINCQDAYAFGTVTNSTFSNNTAGANGGGVRNGGTANLRQCTFSGNATPNGVGGGVYNDGGATNIWNTIVAGSLSGGNCSGTITDIGSNLCDDGTCGFTGDNTDPGLDPNGLQDNGGPTLTIALVAGSSAIDGMADCDALTVDQRGMPRPVGSACDIGAFEVQYTVTYDGNGAASGTVPANQTKTHGVDLILAANSGNLQRTGFTFAGWNTAADGTGRDYAEGATYTANADVTLYAKWTANACTLATAVNPTTGGTVTKNPNQTTYAYGTNVQLTATANAGYGFTGWSGDLSGTANPSNLAMDGNKTVTANFAIPQSLARGKAASFRTTVTKVEMFNGSAWVPLFAGTAQLDLIAGGDFPGVEDINLPQGTYPKLRVTFTNAFSTTGTLSYGGTAYYTTAAAFGGQVDLASVPTTVKGSMAAHAFRIAGWGALDADVVKEFDITPITVTDETDFQPTLRFTLSNRLRLMGVPGSPDTYYFEHAEPGVSVVEWKG